MSRHDLSDADWKRLERLLPTPAKTGRPRKPLRPVVNAMVWILRTGAPWRDLPDEFGPWQTVYHRFNTWRKDGVWTAICDTLVTQTHQAGALDHSLWCMDGSSVRAHPAAAGAGPKGGIPTMTWAAPEVDGQPSSTFSAMAEASH